MTDKRLIVFPRFNSSSIAGSFGWRWFAVLLVLVAATGRAQPTTDYQLGAGDMVKITVFQNSDLTTETRISESGMLTFPLIGTLKVGGMSTGDAEKLIAQRLRNGDFIKEPQVNIVVTQFRSVQVSVLGQVNRPGRYPVEGAISKVTDLVALAGGVTQFGGDKVTLVTTRSGKEQRIEIDLPGMLSSGDLSGDMTVANGDVIFVPRAPQFYIYGEVQRPGPYRLERSMTVMQAVTAGGGLTQRGSERVRLHRKDEAGNVTILEPRMTDGVQVDDVIYVRESWF